MGQPGPAQRRRRCSASPTSSSSATSWPRASSVPPTACGSICATSSRRSSCSAPGATTSPRRSRRSTGSSTSTARRRDRRQRPDHRLRAPPDHRPSRHFRLGKVATKEHEQFAQTMDLIDVMPPGLYEAVITAKEPETAHTGTRLWRLRLRLGPHARPHPRARQQRRGRDRRFATVARVSEVNQGLYRTFLSPPVRAMMNHQVAAAGRSADSTAPAVRRLSAEESADGACGGVRRQVRANRLPAAPENNLFLAMQGRGRGISWRLTMASRCAGLLLQISSSRSMARRCCRRGGSALRRCHCSPAARARCGARNGGGQRGRGARDASEARRGARGDRPRPSLHRIGQSRSGGRRARLCCPAAVPRSATRERSGCRWLRSKNWSENNISCCAPTSSAHSRLFRSSCRRTRPSAALRSSLSARCFRRGRAFARGEEDDGAGRCTVCSRPGDRPCRSPAASAGRWRRQRGARAPPCGGAAETSHRSPAQRSAKPQHRGHATSCPQPESNLYR